MLIIAICQIFLHFLMVYSQVTDEEIQRAQQKYEQMLQHDGKKRLKVIDQKNIKKLLDKNKLVVVKHWLDNGSPKEQIEPKEKQALEVTAQSLQGQSIVIGTMELKSNQEFASAVGIKYTGMITIFNNRRISIYFGQRSPEVMIPYLRKLLLDDPVTVIDSKKAKKLYDQQELPKVVTYLEKRSKELQIFRDAALTFQPMIPFYVVHDAKVAKSLQIKKLKTLQLSKPFQKTVAFPLKTEFTEKEIVQWIHENKRQRLVKMRMENIHEVWAVNTNGHIVPLFADMNKDDGKRFLSAAKLLAKHFEKNLNLSFVWVDPAPFPMMIEYWRESFGIDPLKPIFGVVDVHNHVAAWYDIMNEDEQLSYEVNDMKKWMKKFLNGDIKMTAINKYGAKDEKQTDNKEESLENKDEL